MSQPLPRAPLAILASGLLGSLNLPNTVSKT
jgi:hypothetical protein